MDNIAYLNYISSKQKPKQPFTIKKSIIIAAISIFALIIIIPIISSISNAVANQESDFTPRLYLRVSNLDKILHDYQKKIKSSPLRAETAQLIATTTSIIKELPEKYQESLSPLPSVTLEEQETYNKTIIALENGRINDNFDRVFARYMDYYTSIVLSLDDYVIKTSKNDSLKSYLEVRNSEISQKQQYFSNFTDAY